MLHPRSNLQDKHKFNPSVREALVGMMVDVEVETCAFVMVCGSLKGAASPLHEQLQARRPLKEKKP